MTTQRRARRFIAGLVAFAFVAASVLLGSAPATAVTTITVSGVIPAAARADMTVDAYVSTGSSWAPSGSAHSVNPTTGAFSFTLTKSTKHYTLAFMAGRVPFLDTVLGGLDDLPTSSALGSSVFSAAADADVGTVDLLSAGVIEGTITSSTDGSAIGDADVFAQTTAGSPGGAGEYVTDDYTLSDGSYYLKLAAGQGYAIGVDADGYNSANYATTVTPSSANNDHVAGIDLVMDPTGPSIHGAFFDDNSGGWGNPPAGAPQYEAYLYAVDGSGNATSSIPVQGSGSASSIFDFGPIDPGNYGIAFRDPSTGAWVPWLSYAGSQGTPGQSGSQTSCLLPLTATLNNDIDFGKVTLGATPCAAPFPAAAPFSGHVTNYDGHSSVMATLYFVDPNYLPEFDYYDLGPLRPVNKALVDPNGDYSIPGVSTAGKYVVYFTASDTSPFMDTWLGGFNSASSAGLDSAVAAAPVIADSAASSGNDVALIESATISGTVRIGGTATRNAEVGAFSGSSADDTAPQYGPVLTNSAGHYTLRVAAGTTYTVVAYKSSYLVQYYDRAATPDAATPVLASAGSVASGIDFALFQPPTAIIGIVFDMNSPSADPIPGLRASLYKKTTGYWKKTEAEDITPLSGLGNVFVFPNTQRTDPTSNSSLKPGSYRVRISLNGHWVPLATYILVDVLNGDAHIVNGPVCYAQIDDVKAHQTQLVEAALTFDSAHTCAGEPQHAAAVPAVYSVPRATFPSDGGSRDASEQPTDVPTALPTTPTDAPTTAPVPTSDPTTAPVTAAPTSFLGGVGWVIWVAIGVLLLIVAGGIVLFRRRA